MVQEISREEAEGALQTIMGLLIFKLEPAMRAYAELKQTLREEHPFPEAVHDRFERFTNEFIHSKNPRIGSDPHLMEMGFIATNELLGTLEADITGYLLDSAASKPAHLYAMSKKIEEWDKKYDLPRDHLTLEEHRALLNDRIEAQIIPISKAIRKTPILKEAMRNLIMGEPVTDELNLALINNQEAVEAWQDLIFASGLEMLCSPVSSLYLYTKTAGAALADAMFTASEPEEIKELQATAANKYTIAQRMLEASRKHIAEMHDSNITVTDQMLTRLREYAQNLSKAYDRWVINYQNQHGNNLKSAINLTAGFSQIAYSHAMEIQELVPAPVADDPAFKKMVADFQKGVSSLEEKIQTEGAKIKINSPEFFNVYTLLEGLEERFELSALHAAQAAEKITAAKEKPILRNNKSFQKYLALMTDFMQATVHGTGNSPIAPSVIRKSAHDLIANIDACEAGISTYSGKPTESHNLYPIDKAAIALMRMEHLLEALHAYAIQELNRHTPSTEVGAVEAQNMQVSQPPRQTTMAK